MFETPSPSALLAAWIARPTQRYGEAALEQARLSFVDTLACMIAGADSHPVRCALDAGALCGAGDVPVVGASRRLSLPWGALANGAAAHAIDFDDNLEPALGHASAVLVPCLLSVAATRACSGVELLDAYIVGLEVMGRLGLAFNMDHYSAGWHATSTLGAPAAAAAVARLLKLEPLQTQHALSIAASMAGGGKIQFGTSLKPIHAGIAAKAGVTAALLAAAGLDAAPEALAGPWGLHGLMRGAIHGFDATTPRDDDALIIERFGLIRKIYPSCAAMHRAIDGIIHARQSDGLRADDVSSLRVSMAAIQTQNLRFPKPETPSEARFSLEYCAAAALVDGKLDPSAFTSTAIQRADIRRLAERVSMANDSTLHGQLPADAETPTTLEFVLRDGQTLQRTIAYQRGHQTNPLNSDDLKAKFISLAEPVLGRSQTARLVALLCDLIDLPDAGRLLTEAAPCNQASCGPLD